jgi:hypothetical protein
VRTLPKRWPGRNTVPANICNFYDLRPIRADGYDDVLAFWLYDALGRRELARLKECLRYTRGRENERARYPKPGENAPPQWFNGLRRPLRQRLRLEQASREALQLVAEMRGDAVYPNYAEIANDLVFPPDQLAQADKCIRYHMRMRYHRQNFYTVDVTLYFNKPGTPRNLITYPDKLSKLKPHASCIHIEVRFTGHSVLVANGLGRLSEWLCLDYHSFFQSRLLFYDLDIRKLGRLLDNRLTGHGRRMAQSRDYNIGLHDFHEHGLVKDRSTGSNSYFSIQQYVDARRQFVNLYPALIPLDNSHLLPKPTTFTPYNECIPNVFFKKSMTQPKVNDLTHANPRTAYSTPDLHGGDPPSTRKSS